MRILFVSIKGDGAWFVWLLRHNGHDVAWHVVEEKYRDSLTGILPAQLAKLPDPAPYDLVVFDSDGRGAEADACRTLTPTIGSSALADRLESDRLFGLEVMEQVGIRVPAWEAFDSPEKGIAWLEQTKKRTVFKPIGEVPGDDKSTTYVSHSHTDMISFMDKVFTKAKITSYILQEVVSGTEVSTEAWWNGSEWYALNHTLEEKKLMSGGLGPNTGCAGNVLWMPSRPNPIFQQGLEKVGTFLKQHNFVGNVDLNTIATDGNLYGLEWTPRFGYEGTCNLTQLLPMEFGEFLFRCATGQTLTLGQSRHRFVASVRVSVPPYPNAELSRRKLVVPILGVDIKNLERMVLYDVRKSENEGELETTGIYNSVCAPLGCGDSIGAAVQSAEYAISQLNIPDAMYRNDLTARLNERFQVLLSQGWLKSIG